jgi:tetratricopeptide (TPR) repeat protein
MTVCAGLAWIGWTVLAPRPRLDEGRLKGLTGSGRFEEAVSLLESHLRRTPRDARAHYLLAELLLSRTDRTGESHVVPDARRALDHLEQARGSRVVDPARVELYRGMSLYRLDRWDEAEAAWSEALRIDPVVPEAGWGLLDLYYLEGRRLEAQRLVLRLHQVEPLPQDRAQLLLQLVRQDAIPPDQISLVERLEPVVAESPDGVQALTALGLALVRSGEIDLGLASLRRSVERWPDSETAWDRLMTGLDFAGKTQGLSPLLAGLPRSMADSPRFARHFALAAQEEGRWGESVAQYRRAMEHDPGDFETGVRFARALRFAGEKDAAMAWDRKIVDYRAAKAGLLDLYEEADAVKTLGVRPHPELCRELAESREKMWRGEEARLWRSMAE